MIKVFHAVQSPYNIKEIYIFTGHHETLGKIAPLK